MCIIADKPAGVSMPSVEDIKYMFERNKNGAGFALQGWFDHTDRQGKKTRKFEVRYSKGYMKVEDLIEALGDFDKLKNVRVVIHCRITTSGYSDQQTCHPFPLSYCYGHLRKLQGRGPVLFHNGVFQGLGNIIDKHSSDTQDFVVGVANKILKDSRHISKISRAVAKQVAGPCRVLILYPDPKHPDFRLGEWHEYKGVQYSNTGYRHPYTTTTPPTSQTTLNGMYNGIDDDDEYDQWWQQHQPGEDAGHKYDRFGANIAEYALPDEDTHWIKFQSIARLNIVKNLACDEEIGPQGENLYYFNYDIENPWIIDEANLQAYDMDGYNMIEDAKVIEEQEIAKLYDENCFWASTKQEFDNWLKNARMMANFVARKYNKTWYLDTETLAAYTDDGLKLLYKEGEVGHVRSALCQFGKDTYTQKRTQMQKIAKDATTKLLTEGK